MIDHRMKIYHFSKKILSIHVFFVFFHQTSYIFQSIISPQIYQFINFPFIPRLSSKFRDWIDYEDRFEMKENLEERSKRKKKNPFDPLTCFSVSCRELLTRHPLCCCLPRHETNFERDDRSADRSSNAPQTFHLDCLPRTPSDWPHVEPPRFERNRAAAAGFYFRPSPPRSRIPHGRATRQPPHKGSKKTIQSPRGLGPESRLLRSRLTQRLVNLSVYERERKNLRRKKVENSILESRRARASCECMGGRGGGGEEQSIKEKKTRP